MTVSVLNYYGFITGFETSKFESYYFVHVFQNHFDYSGSLGFPYEFEDQLVDFYLPAQKRDCVEYVNQFGKYFNDIKKTNMGCLFI